MNNIQLMQDARLQKCLNTKYNFNGIIMTLENFFLKNPPLFKQIFIQEYSDKRIHLEYKKLNAPKKHYTIFYNSNQCVEVPKLVYDYYDIPEKE